METLGSWRGCDVGTHCKLECQPFKWSKVQVKFPFDYKWYVEPAEPHKHRMFMIHAHHIQIYPPVWLSSSLSLSFFLRGFSEALIDSMSLNRSAGWRKDPASRAGLEPESCLPRPFLVRLGFKQKPQIRGKLKSWNPWNLDLLGTLKVRAQLGVHRVLPEVWGLLNKSSKESFLHQPLARTTHEGWLILFGGFDWVYFYHDDILIYIIRVHVLWTCTQHLCISPMITILASPKACGSVVVQWKHGGSTRGGPEFQGRFCVSKSGLLLYCTWSFICILQEICSSGFRKGTPWSTRHGWHSPTRTTYTWGPHSRIWMDLDTRSLANWDPTRLIA